MKNCVLVILLSVCAFAQTNTRVNNLSASGNVTVGGGKPWYDVTSSVFGAKCDGTTDDTTAIQAAATAANAAHGGIVYIPPTKTCAIATNLVFDNFQNVRLTNGAGAFPFQGGATGGLKFTGTSGPLISCKSCFGVRIDHLLLQYTGAFSGVFIEFGHSGLGFDSFNNYIGYNWIGKTGAGGGAVLISLDQADQTIIEGNHFSDGTVAIRGRNAPSGAGTDYSNNNTIQRNTFGNSGIAAFTTAFIQNLGTGNIVQGNDFEIGSSGAPTMAWSGAMSSSGSVIGNWDGDMTGVATFTKYAFPANSKWDVSGNLISAVSANVATFSLGNTSSLSIHGNNFAEGSTFGTFLTVGTSDTVSVEANSYGTLSAFLSGTPASGSATDNTGKTTLWGGAALNGTISSSGQIQSTIATGTAPFTVSSTTSVATLQVSRHPIVKSCQGANPCANALSTDQLFVYDGGANYTLSGGTLTVTGFPYTANNSFGCYAWDTTNAANKVIPSNNSGSSVTFTGITTDTFKFFCIGN